MNENRAANTGKITVAALEPFYGVGMLYKNFSQTGDEEAIELLARAADFGNGETLRAA